MKASAIQFVRHVSPLVTALLLGSLLWGTSGDSPIGSWEGESKCTVPDSPCHDEHALYRIAADKSDPAKLRLEGYKIVSGSPEFMGTLACDYQTSQSTLTCRDNSRKQDVWEFRLSGDAMNGTLTIGPEKTLYRRISLHRK